MKNAELGEIVTNAIWRGGRFEKYRPAAKPNQLNRATRDKQINPIIEGKRPTRKKTVQRQEQLRRYLGQLHGSGGRRTVRYSLFGWGSRRKQTGRNTRKNYIDAQAMIKLSIIVTAETYGNTLRGERSNN